MFYDQWKPRFFIIVAHPFFIMTKQELYNKVAAIVRQTNENPKIKRLVDDCLRAGMTAQEIEDFTIELLRQSYEENP